MKVSIHNRIFVLAGAIVAFTMSGCANTLEPNVRKAPTSSSQYGGSYALEDETPTDGFNCPDTANVIPDYDWEFDGSNFYKVCGRSDNRAPIRVSGSTAHSNTICVFPAQEIITSDGRTVVYWKPDTNGSPWHKCADLSSGAADFTFEGISWNAAFIVELPDRYQMRQCLPGGNYFTCPHYSYGTFR